MNRGEVNEIREALSRLPMLGRTELRAEWRRLYGTDAPVRLGRELLTGAAAPSRRPISAIGRAIP